MPQNRGESEEMDNNIINISCNFAIEGVDLEKKSIPVILSDESEVVRYNYEDGKHFIKLLHGEENVDLSRKDILSLFVNHNTYELPTAIFENVRLEERKLKASSVFDESDSDSMKIFNKLAKGFLKSFSVGITIIEKVLEKEIDGVRYYNVTKWILNEASVVGIPAIPTAKVGLQEENDGVNRAKVEALAINQNLTQGNVMNEEQLQALRDEHAEALNTAGANATDAERKRVSGIISLRGDESIKLKAINDGSSVGDTAIALNASADEVLTKEKIDFEAAAAELAGNSQKHDDGTDLTDEQLKEKQADEALSKHQEGKK